MSLSPQQLEDRRQGMTATDLAAVLGVHPHRSPLHVFLEKIGAAPPFNGNERTKWGEKLEPMIRDDYATRHGVSVETHGTHRHPKVRWWMATPDGLVYPRGAQMPERGLEIKVHDREAVWFGGLEYGAPGSDEVPPHELIQCMWGIGATRLRVWDLVAFLGARPVDYTILRDDELLEMMAEEGERFFIDHVKARVEPPHDGSAAWDVYLKRKWKANSADLINVDDNAEALALVSAIRKARSHEADAQTAKAVATQALKNIIADRAGITWTDPETGKSEKITWKRSRDGFRDDYRTTVQGMRNRAAMFASAHADIAATLGDALRDTVAEGGEFAERIAPLSAFVDGAFAELRAIAEFPIVQNAATGARPFLVPRWWKGRREEKNEDEDAAKGGAIDNTKTKETDQ